MANRSGTVAVVVTALLAVAVLVGMGLALLPALLVAGLGAVTLLQAQQRLAHLQQQLDAQQLRLEQLAQQLQQRGDHPATAPATAVPVSAEIGERSAAEIVANDAPVSVAGDAAWTSAAATTAEDDRPSRAADLAGAQAQPVSGTSAEAPLVIGSSAAARRDAARVQQLAASVPPGAQDPARALAPAEAAASAAARRADGAQTSTAAVTLPAGSDATAAADSLAATVGGGEQAAPQRSDRTPSPAAFPGEASQADLQKQAADPSLPPGSPADPVVAGPGSALETMPDAVATVVPSASPDAAAASAPAATSSPSVASAVRPSETAASPSTPVTSSSLGVAAAVPTAERERGAAPAVPMAPAAPSQAGIPPHAAVGTVALEAVAPSRTAAPSAAGGGNSSPPSGPDHGDALTGFAARLRNRLAGGNALAKLGVLLLFIGLAFLLRHATEGWVVPIWLRYLGVAAVGGVLAGVGVLLRRRRPGYAQILQGAGIAVLYLTTLATVKLHPLLPTGVGLTLMVVLSALLVWRALRENSEALAVVALAGALAAPVLVSTGSSQALALFSYLLVLNLALTAISAVRQWRQLNRVALIGTFALAAAWGVRDYQPALLWQVEPFLLALVALHGLMGVLLSRQSLNAGRSLARTLQGGQLLAPPLLGLGLQAAVVGHLPYAMAISALGWGLFYGVLAWGTRRRWGAPAALLTDTCAMLALVFASLAIPLALNAGWSAAVWAVEGAGLYWLGSRQQRRAPRWLGVVIQGGALLAFLASLRHGVDTALAGSSLGLWLLVAAFATSAALMRRQPAADGRLQPLWGVVLAALLLLSPLLHSAQALYWVLAWAGLAVAVLLLAWQQRWPLLAAVGSALLALSAFGWLLGLLARVLDHGLQPPLWQGLLVSGLLATGAAALYRLGGRWRWAAGTALAATLLVWGVVWLEWLTAAWQGRALWAALLALIAATGLLLRGYGALLAWPAAARGLLAVAPLALLALLLGWPRTAPVLAGWVPLAWLALLAAHAVGLATLAAAGRLAHAAGAVLTVVLAALAVGEGVSGGWPWSAWGRWAALAMGLAALWALSRSAAPRRWPLRLQPAAYQQLALPLLALGTWLSAVLLLTGSGAGFGLRYLPLLNPLELLALALVALWPTLWRAAPGWQQHGSRVLAGLLWAVWATTLVMRTAYHWLQVPWHSSAMLHSMFVQAGWSLVWMLMALALMWGGHRRGQRSLWMVGAAVIAVVVLKLFLVELGQQGSLARIVSFIGVGVLVLVVGYVAPLPPRQANRSE
ncbi:DUF2339 domain-containing protein [Isoalcanivorax beigongshangi]|uniref:DUF2339 domain-containing protein n=1 Tax=Isoalcanivorax beigongshangi TaxID=3238810 RepID=A0ABV4AI87_9GAMM